MRVYLAATEDLYRDRLCVRVPRMLISYFGTEARFDVAMKAGQFPTDWCIDSGAHFFLSAFFKRQERAAPEIAEAHLVKFLNYLRSRDTKPSFAVELDLQDLYGHDLIEGWRANILKPFEQETGIRIAYAWHGVDGYSRWRGLIDNPDVKFMAMSLPRNTDLHVLAKYVHEAYEAGKPVHGFACVKERLLKVIPFYSVDSTSWGSGSLFGTVQKFNHGTGSVRAHAAGRSVFRKDPKKAAAAILKSGGQVHLRDTLGVQAGGSLSRLYQNSADAYSQFETWYTSYWKIKGVDWEGRLGSQAAAVG